MFQKTMRGICLAFSLLAFAGNSNAQRYEDMSPEVQGQMDLNKINGVHVLKGIKVDFEFTIKGVSDGASSAVLEELLRSEFGLIAYQFNPATKHVSYTLPASYNAEKLKSKLKEKGFVFGQFFKENYHL